VNCVSHTIVENLKQFAFKGDKSRVVRRTFWLIKVVHRTLWLIKVVPTWKKFENRWVTGCNNGLNILTIVRSAHTVFTRFVFVWEQTATCATYSINWLVFITEMKRFTGEFTCLEDRTDRMFRNVGQHKPDAGETTRKKTHWILNTAKV
jgi:hypothetical protein